MNEGAIILTDFTSPAVVVSFPSSEEFAFPGSVFYLVYSNFRIPFQNHIWELTGVRKITLLSPHAHFYIGKCFGFLSGSH